MTVIFICKPCAGGRHGDCKSWPSPSCQCLDEQGHPDAHAEVDAWFDREIAKVPADEWQKLAELWTSPPKWTDPQVADGRHGEVTQPGTDGDGVPVWLRREFPDVDGWQCFGDNRYRGRHVADGHEDCWCAPLRQDCWCYVACDDVRFFARCVTFVFEREAVSIEVGPFAFDMLDRRLAFAAGAR